MYNVLATRTGSLNHTLKGQSRLGMDPTISAYAGDVKRIYKVEINNNNKSQKDSHAETKKEDKADKSRLPRQNRRRTRPQREPKPKKDKPVKTIDDIANKNAVMMLNELFSSDRAPIYKVVSQEGPANNPYFMMSCNVEGQTFQGSGKSKKDAKLACSREAIHQLFGINNLKLDEESEAGVSQEEGVVYPARVQSSFDNLMEMEGKNPISILNEMYPGVQYLLLSSEGPSHSPEFVMEASLLPHAVIGTGKSKKDAKLNASKALLVKLHQVAFCPQTSEIMTKFASGDLGIKSEQFSHTFADKVASLVTDKFNEIFGMTSHSKRKVLAGFVVTRGKISEVLCISTGTKCINGENLSLSGLSINDSHAEILARRGLLYWLYDQLELASSQNKHSIFIPSTDGGFDLREDVSFDMYINTAPCGDSRLFAMNEESSDDQNLLISPAGKIGEGNRGKLRSKVESGMGTVPLNTSESAIQTWDGIAGGERLLTMSCSDKILRWNMLGCQGSLLSHWIKPIFMRSITIGSRYHPGHMSRAFFERCPDQMYVNKPQLLATTSPESRAVWKTSESCVVWIDGAGPEILNGVNGKLLQTNDPSRLCKDLLMKKFKQLASFEQAIPRHDKKKEKLVKLSYMDLKLEAEAYQKSKNEMIDALKISGAGKWIKKPVELDLFYSK